MDRDTFKVRPFLCEACGTAKESLQWNYDPAPVCCDQPMVEGRQNTTTLQIITDDVPGGFTVHNGFQQPTTFYSKSAHRRALSANGCKLAEKGECGF